MSELLIVDDNEALRRWAERVVAELGYSCDVAEDAAGARRQMDHSAYKLVLLDVNMPGESGLELLSHIRTSHSDAAVVMVTAQDDTQLAMTAIELGAYGYLIKPVGAGELLINVANALHRRQREQEGQRALQSLQFTVSERNQELEGALQDLRLSKNQVRVSQAETIFRLARMVEFRDEDTGHHLHRMSSFCEILARRVGFGEQRAELVRLASQLHDIGKVAVPDSILLKPGKLTTEEFEVMKGHAETGFQMLADSPSEVVQMGALIARTHHEHWSGGGYPRGLSGEEIPPEGRIAALADAFDALTSDRVYRPAFPVRSAVEIMREEHGHFDPQMFGELCAALPELEAIRTVYSD
jgi:putative two-component system response regulator